MQLVLHNLAGTGFREIFHKLDCPGHLVYYQVFTAIGQYAIFLCLCLTSLTKCFIDYHNHLSKISLHFPGPGESFWHHHTLPDFKMLRGTSIGRKYQFTADYRYKFINGKVP